MLSSWLEQIWILGIALSWDLILGEPPRKLHPVIWMGWLIQRFRSGTSAPAPIGLALFYGPLISIFLGVYLGLIQQIPNLPIRIAISSYLLKSCFAIKDMHLHLDRIRAALMDSDLTRARQQVSMIVSRDTSKLSRSQLISASIESSCDSLCDSVLGPIFYFWLFGIPGAIIYRIANTLDSMLGYPGIKLGKYVAKLDELLGFIPARIGSGLILISALILGKDWRNGLKVLREHRTRVPSSNAGCQIAAMAGALGVELEKPGFYRVGYPNRELSLDQIQEALKLWDLSWILFMIGICCPWVLIEVL